MLVYLTAVHVKIASVCSIYKCNFSSHHKSFLPTLSFIGSLGAHCSVNDRRNGYQVC